MGIGWRSDNVLLREREFIVLVGGRVRRSRAVSPLLAIIFDGRGVGPMAGRGSRRIRRLGRGYRFVDRVLSTIFSGRRLRLMGGAFTGWALRLHRAY